MAEQREKKKECRDKEEKRWRIPLLRRGGGGGRN